jgi:hypothetical protein
VSRSGARPIYEHEPDAWRGNDPTKMNGSEFAAQRGLVATKFGWWASRLGRGGRTVQLGPVRVVEEPDRVAGVDVGGEQPVAWTLRTSRGELRVHRGEPSTPLLSVA